jgi:hypothetical protein
MTTRSLALVVALLVGGVAQAQTKPFRADGGVQTATQSGWTGPNGVPGLYYKLSSGWWIRNPDNSELGPLGAGGGGASTGNWTFSGNTATLTGAGTLSLGTTVATAVAIGGSSLGSGMTLGVSSGSAINVQYGGVTNLALTSTLMQFSGGTNKTINIATAPADAQGYQLSLSGGGAGTASTTNGQPGGQLFGSGGKGANASGTFTAGGGGQNQWIGGTGGDGSATLVSGAGGPLLLAGGPAGTNGGAGQGIGGTVTIRGGLGATNGTVSIGTSNTSSIAMGAAGVATTITGGATVKPGSDSASGITVQANSATQTGHLFRSMDGTNTNELASVQLTDSGQSNRLVLSSQLNAGYEYLTVSSAAGSFVAHLLINGGILQAEASSYQWLSTNGAATYASLDSNGFHAQHIGGAGTAPTKAAGACLGGTQTVTLDANASDSAGTLTMTSTATGTASSTCATVTFNAAWGTAPHCQISPSNAAAAALSGTSSLYLDSASTSTTAFVVKVGSTALPAGTYLYTYDCAQ